MKRRLLLLTPGALVAGCNGTLWPAPVAPALRYGLDDAPLPKPGDASRTPAGAPLLRVALPRAAAELGTVQMLYRAADTSLHAFAQSEWAAPPAHLLAPLIVQVLARTGSFAVVPAASSAQAQLLLETELLQLHQDFAQSPSQLRLGLSARLLDGRSRERIASCTFEQPWACATDDAPGQVRAARAALRPLMAALSTFCVDALPQWRRYAAAQTPPAR